MKKKIIFSIALILVVLSFNISYSQDVRINESLESLSKKLEHNRKELNSINKDLLAIAQTLIGKSSADNISHIIDNTSAIEVSYLYQLYLIDVKDYVSVNKLNSFFFLILRTLQITKEEIEHRHKLIDFAYPFLTNKAALHSVDKARKNVLDSLSEIESAITF